MINGSTHGKLGLVATSAVALSPIDVQVNWASLAIAMFPLHYSTQSVVRPIRSSNTDETLLHASNDSLCPCRDIEFDVDVNEMRLDGSNSHGQPPCDLFV